MTKGPDKALVVLSGGQDSTTCLYWAIDRFGRANVSSITFDYGQKHRIELECARNVAAAAGVPNACLPIDTFAALGGDALTDTSIPVSDEADEETELPVTFVAGRNLIFLTFAAAYAYRHDVRHLVTGVAQTDYSGYPDCRKETMAALQEAITLGMDREFTIHTPLMHRSKKETVELAVQLGALEMLALTHTCYNGRRPPCGDCQACRLRARGFAEAGVRDPLLDIR
ncbi:MAG: 7-cyano-7-deazaguanine synthase QueC [Gammaproteobacteria bacterium]|jgi:7-cyano-7-deazaguanine synthase|nr:7-cyano-7-deazaguanine synthase QueC [Gammaproteobacteria bacterium]MDH3848065.1 7-cyano-7-deazaguanine synthase QueC [Gammaproteobacteria bacterium]MDH3863727.1 7-cyano-7-deazaguanine synthase QueC [Gammaproteobacteria bacterium]MDH3904345.1 7-cyano-7-deazaguanine synthase QueC [Gammaproteobacteria bacterium]MDH3909219.1 7-cyano-7-deazaguanine synthase QueC [Gammaproteobacteria bacterium]